MGNEIPLCARLMAIVDVYDALISPRSYKPPYPHAEALKVILDGAGTHFDPILVSLFHKKSDEIYNKSRMILEDEDVCLINHKDGKIDYTLV